MKSKANKKKTTMPVGSGDLLGRLTECLKVAVENHPKSQPSITAAANRNGDVVVVTSYAFLKENGFFEPDGFLTNFGASLPIIIQTLPEI